MQNAVLKKWQHSWGTALALLALLAWCMPTLAMGCAISSMPSAEMLQCSGIYSDVLPDAAVMQQMPCCHTVPLSQSTSSNNRLAVVSTDGHLQVSSAAYPPSHAPLWALLIVSADYDVDIQAVFSLENFFPPLAVYASSPLHGRAPPSLI